MVSARPIAQSHATSEWSQLARQAFHALASRAQLEEHVSTLIARLQRDEGRIESQLGYPLRNFEMLEIGPGQSCERSRD